MTAQHTPTFGISIGSIFRAGIVGYFKHIGPLTAAALATLATYAVFRIPAQIALNDDFLVRSIALDLVGLVLAGVVAYPWYSFALDVADEKPIDVGKPFRSYSWVSKQLIASIFFWAGVLLGLRYLFGLPSIVIAIFYAFYGYALADGAKNGLVALGTSVAVGDGKRIGLFAIASLFLLFNLFGAVALGFTVNGLTIVLAVLGLAVTTSITMVSGAVVFRTLQAQKGAP